MGLALAAMGTHPWANYLDQHIIDTEHYRRLEGDLRWVAQRNNTWSLHVHVGVRGADRAVAVCDRMRRAASAAARALGELAVPRPPRHRACTPCAPRSSRGPSRAAASTSPSATGELRGLRPAAGGHQLDRRGDAALVERPPAPLASARSRSGSATPRRRGDESFNLAALIAACVAQARDRPRRGGSPSPMRRRGDRGEPLAGDPLRMDGEMIDFRERRVVPTRTVLERVVEWTEPAATGARARCGPAGAQRRPAGLCSLRRGRADRGDLPARRRGDPARPTRRREPSVADEGSSRAARASRARASRARRRSAPSSRRRSARSGSRT